VTATGRDLKFVAIGHKKSVVVDSQFSLKPTFNGNLSAMAGG